MMLRCVLITIFCLVAVSSFSSGPSTATRPRFLVGTMLSQSNDDSGSTEFNPMKTWSNMMSTIDDMIDDFFYKRMGNGEIFYGKRKVNPSGKVEGAYNGFGLSDKQRIEDSRLVKLARIEQKRLKELERSQK